MADLLKDGLNKDYLCKLAQDFAAVYDQFHGEDFVAAVMDDTWDNLELKGRMRQITVCLKKFLPDNYAEAISIIDKVIAGYGDWRTGFGAMFLPDYVEVYGLDEADWDISIAALERYTPHASAEFAVRPFIIKDEGRMMAQMLAWSKSSNADVRRLASEGCRPALPWAQALPRFKKDPTPILPILEQLKADPDAYVRKSVANNLNDISKTHPELVAGIAKEWFGNNKDTDWVVKHACRTLLKQSNREVLAIFGFDDADAIATDSFAISNTAVRIGYSFDFSFNISAKADTKVRLEYAIDFVKAKGKRSRKIFQISESVLNGGKSKSYVKSHSFADLSTRTHYAGVHSITLIVNGVERGTLDFELTN